MKDDAMSFDAWTDRLSEYLDDELPAPEHAALDEHLRDCLACRAVLEDLRRVQARARTLRDGDPALELWTGIARRIGAPGVRLEDPAGAALPADDAPDELAARRARRSLAMPWLRWGAAAAAVLVVGIGIGRATAPGPDTLATHVVAAPAPGTSAASDPFRLAAVEHLERTRALLTTFRAETARGAARPATGRWADDLLLQTRLLLDSPAAADPRLRSLLQDLELVLVQIARLPQSTSPSSDTEVDLANRAIEESRVLPRMRNLVPAGPSAALTGES